MKKKKQSNNPPENSAENGRVHSKDEFRAGDEIPREFEFDFLSVLE